MAKGHPKIRARYAIRGAGFWIWDAEFGVEAGGVSPNPPSGRRQRLVVYCNGRCTGAAGRRIRPHPAFWELCCSLPRIYEVINEIKNAAAKRTKKNTHKKGTPKPREWNRARYLVLAPAPAAAPRSDSIFSYWSCGKCPRTISEHLFTFRAVLCFFMQDLSLTFAPGPSCLAALLTCLVFCHSKCK